MGHSATAAARPGPGESGATIVEFALLAPVFLALLGAIMEFSGIMFAQTLLEGAAREASRYGITGQAPEGTDAGEPFALAAPVLIMLMLASVALARFVILDQKLDRVAISTSDLVARAETISESKLDDIFIAAEQVAQPFELAASGRVIVSSVINEDGDGPTIAWQRSDDGTLSATSKVGHDGGTATLPDGSRCARARRRSSPTSSSASRRSSLS